MPEKIHVTQTTIMPALILDLDGTVRRTISGKAFSENLEDVEIFPEMLKLIPNYRQFGYLILGVTNQGGVAHGYKTMEDLDKEILHTVNLFGKRPNFHMIKACPSMEGGSIAPYNMKSLSRKPYYGMLAVMEHSLAHGQHIIIDWNKSLFVGDREEDKQCAEAAGITFEWADNFRNRMHVFEIETGGDPKAKMN